MAKSRFNLGDTMKSAAAIIEKEPTQEDTKPLEEEKAQAQTTVSPAPKAEEKKVETPKAEAKPATRKGPKSGTEGKGHVINANLDDEIYWRADIIKKRLNKERVGDAPFVSINTMLCNALEEWLDRNYPETKGQYKQLQEMGVL